VKARKKLKKRMLKKKLLRSLRKRAEIRLRKKFRLVVLFFSIDGIRARLFHPSFLLLSSIRNSAMILETAIILPMCRRSGSKSLIRPIMSALSYTMLI